MHAVRLIAWMPFVFLAAGCATQSASYDYDQKVDFSTFQDWAWLPHPEDQPSGDPRVDNPLTRQRIEAAIAGNLEDRGYRLVDAGSADFRVGYVVTVRRVPGSTYVGTSFGFGRYGGGSGVGVSFGGPARPLDEHEEGTLLIDIRDAKSDNLAWRGSSTGRLDPSATPGESEQRIKGFVDEILANFPPGKGS